MNALLVLVLPSKAATLTVDPSSSTAYSTIKDAIHDAKSGDTIEVAAATFTECVDPGGKNLAVKGAGSGSTFISGRGACANAVTVDHGETAKLSGMTVTNGSYRCLYVYGSDVTLDDMVFTGCGSTSLYGGGGYLDSATVTATDSEFSSNQAPTPAAACG